MGAPPFSTSRPDLRGRHGEQGSQELCVIWRDSPSTPGPSDPAPTGRLPSRPSTWLAHRNGSQQTSSASVTGAERHLRAAVLDSAAAAAVTSFCGAALETERRARSGALTSLPQSRAWTRLVGPRSARFGRPRAGLRVSQGAPVQVKGPRARRRVRRWSDPGAGLPGLDLALDDTAASPAACWLSLPWTRRSRTERAGPVQFRSRLKGIPSMAGSPLSLHPCRPRCACSRAAAASRSTIQARAAAAVGNPDASGWPGSGLGRPVAGTDEAFEDQGQAPTLKSLIASPDDMAAATRRIKPVHGLLGDSPQPASLDAGHHAELVRGTEAAPLAADRPAPGPARPRAGGRRSVGSVSTKRDTAQGWSDGETGARGASRRPRLALDRLVVQSQSPRQPLPLTIVSRKPLNSSIALHRSGWLSAA